MFMCAGSNFGWAFKMYVNVLRILVVVHLCVFEFYFEEVYRIGISFKKQSIIGAGLTVTYNFQNSQDRNCFPT